MYRFITLSVLVLLQLGLLAASAGAKPVYKWQDETGTVHYSSKPVNKNAKPAELPPITRGEVQLTKRKLISCGDHGGINCKAGADTDGSVICYDGFRNASPRYRFSCNSPKLEISEIGDIEADGSFRVMVRNAKSVVASSAAVLFKPDMGPEVKLVGPDEIEAFGIAEFRFNPQDNDIPQTKVDLAQLDVKCANCPK